MLCDFELEPGGTVYVIVRDQEKNPIEGARVILMKGFQEVSTRQFPETDVLGEVTLEGVSIANPPMVMAFKEGYEIMGQMPQKPEFHEGETEAEVGRLHSGYRGLPAKVRHR